MIANQVDIMIANQVDIMIANQVDIMIANQVVQSVLVGAGWKDAKIGTETACPWWGKWF